MHFECAFAKRQHVVLAHMLERIGREMTVVCSVSCWHSSESTQEAGAGAGAGAGAYPPLVCSLLSNAACTHPRCHCKVSRWSRRHPQLVRVVLSKCKDSSSVRHLQARLGLGVCGFGLWSSSPNARTRPASVTCQTTSPCRF